MKESKINNEIPEKITSAAIYSLGSCSFWSRLEGVTKTQHQISRVSPNSHTWSMQGKAAVGHIRITVLTQNVCTSHRAQLELGQAGTQ